MIISLYAGSMTVGDIAHHLAKTIGTELSHETIAKILLTRPESRSPPGRSGPDKSSTR